MGSTSKVQPDEKSETEFRKALERVGSRPIKNLQWFMEWWMKPLPSATDMNALERVWQDLLALSILASRSQRPESQRMQLSNEECGIWQSATGIKDQWRFEIVLHIRVLVGEILNATANKQCIEVLLPQVILRIGDPGSSGTLYPINRLIARNSLGDIDFEVHSGAEGAVMLRLKQLLDLHGLRLRRCQCQSCPKHIYFFIAGRKDTRYCSHQCRSKINMKNWRERNRLPKSTRRGRGRERKGGGRHGKKRR